LRTSLTAAPQGLSVVRISGSFSSSASTAWQILQLPLIFSPS